MASFDTLTHIIYFYANSTGYSSGDFRFYTSSYLFNSRIIDAGEIIESLPKLPYTNKVESPVEVILDNTDGHFTEEVAKAEFRGTTVAYRIYEVVNGYIPSAVAKVTKFFTINRYVLTNEKFHVQLTASKTDVYDITIPKERITTDRFSTSADDSVIGKGIPTWFGNCIDVPLYSIREYGTGDAYRHDFLIGFGELESLDELRSTGSINTRVMSSDEYELFISGAEKCTGTITSISGDAGGTLNDTGGDFITDGVVSGDWIFNTTKDKGMKLDTIGATSLVVTEDFDVTDWEVGDAYVIGRYAIISFYAQQRDANGNLLDLRADIKGVKIGGVYETNGAAIVEEFLENTVWGLGQSAPSFSALKSQFTGYDFNMGFYEFKRAREWLDLMMTSLKFSSITGTTMTAPEYVDTISQTFTEQNMRDVAYYKRPLDEYVNEVALQYDYNFKDNVYNKEYRATIGQSFGTTKEFYAPFISDTAIGTLIGTYLKNRFEYQDDIIEFNTGQDGLTLEAGDKINITHETFGISAQDFEVIEIRKGEEFVFIRAYSYSDQIFQES